MVRCEEFYKYFEKKGNFCGKSDMVVKKVEEYIDYVKRNKIGGYKISNCALDPFISIESVNPKVLESMNKGQLNGMDQSAGMGLLKEVFSALSEHNIEFGISTIAGYEGDDF